MGENAISLNSEHNEGLLTLHFPKATSLTSMSRVLLPQFPGLEYLHERLPKNEEKNSWLSNYKLV